ncbi:head GIN domain-containing protein [Hymenobacter arizonensis]|uniref:Putative auto-transporter adhesin, head GIN domain n=1 Tax=Hymenobacter arizonensis TaxID=1227077 RepID=A0A1I5XM99_HYMAR|nr:head GIN domain-containing protein [Hymenobacter arizonensis]SFQ32847.1 Putative auto-transporter adhesin, head GIN domain [Hymenobacter arizonensis]
MTTLRINSLWAGLAVLLVGVLSSFSEPRIAVQRETRPVDVFTEVNLGGSARVVVKQGSPQSVVVEASPEALAEFETVVKDKQLRLGFRRDNDFKSRMKNYGPVMVYITAPSLTALKVAGSGQLDAEGPIKGESMNLTVAGSGNLRVPQLTATLLQTSVAGSGDLQVSGNCPQHEVSISGSGNVKAQDLKTETCKVRISGSGDAHVYTSKAADARISGSGNVYVAGGGQMSSSTNGSGRIKTVQN